MYRFKCSFKLADISRSCEENKMVPFFLCHFKYNAVVFVK